MLVTEIMALLVVGLGVISTVEEFIKNKRINYWAAACSLWCVNYILK